MPELPEVETVRRGLEPVLEGRVLARVLARRNDLRFPLPKNFAARLTGRRVLRLSRRAKYILAHLDNGEVLLIHLGMSGRFQIEGQGVGRFVHAGAPPGKHDHVEFLTDAGARVVYTDHRRFGSMDLVPEAHLATHRLLRAIGPEPLSEAFDGALLAARLEGKRTPIKSALLDQRVVAGLGNIYVCEALFRAGISPRRQASTVRLARTERLVPDIKAVLEEAILAGGSTLRDFKDTSGELGYFQHRFDVYDREGEACRRCGAPVRRIVQAGRSTFFCSGCQR
ncbi:MAG: bifunctional DNA-formamidopyrimidine glycosylase/DNA-(apurinic or apyrimidinic site) lyase [Alphaproteobacteria bacterium]|nr:bifunctional DNA-formamidopyrimidine glycosylase/DNA-(apurinic or apyrimidinic site) lyase [Alphaproteobacteria bacterium]